MKKLCIFAPFYSLVGQRMLEYYDEILTPHAEIFLFCRENDRKKFNLKNIKIVSHDSNKIFVAEELKKFCLKNKIDFITNLSRRAKVALVMVYASLFSNAKVVFYDHGNPSFSGILGIFPLQVFLSRILTCSEAVAQKYRKFLLFSKKRINCMYTSINTEEFKPISKSVIRKKLNLNLQEKIIVYSGRVQYLKGSDYLLKVIKQNPDKKFVLIGEVMDENFKKEELKNIIFIPHAELKQLKEWYNSADLCVFLSRSEGLSVALREIMACKIPAIISEIEGHEEITPAIRVPFDLEKIQNKIDWFFSLDKKSREKISKESREFIVKNYSEKVLRKSHLEYLLNIK